MPERICQYVVNQEYQETGRSHRTSHLADQLGQPVQLQVQRRLHPRQFRSLPRHVTYLRLVTHSRHHIAPRPTHHHRRAQHPILGVSLLSRQRMFNVFRRQHLSRQARLIHLQVSSLHQLSVGRYLVARLHQHHVAHDHLAAGYLHHLAVANHLHRLFLAQLCQHVELTCRITLEIEAHRRGQNHCRNDAQRLDEVILHKRQHQRHQCCHQQDAHHRVLIFLQIQPPHRLVLRRCQHVLAMLTPALLHLCGCQSLSHFHIHAAKVQQKIRLTSLINAYKC